VETLTEYVGSAGLWIEHAIRSSGATPEAVGAALILVGLVFLVGQTGASILREV
jgi:hypothetical protein